MNVEAQMYDKLLKLQKELEATRQEALRYKEAYADLKRDLATFYKVMSQAHEDVSVEEDPYKDAWNMGEDL